MPGNGIEARMLERRVSNNRSDLDGDQKMNHFLSWFTQWSDLQKSDFVYVLVEKMSSTVNGGFHDPSDPMSSLSLGAKKAPSLFDCQIKLFKEWFSGWSDDQKNYLNMRLKDMDGSFFSKFEDRMASGGRTPPEKDYFEPGVPDELMRHSMIDTESVSNNLDTSVHAKLVEVSEDEESDDVDEEEDQDDLKGGFGDNIKDGIEPYPRKGSINLETINEDTCQNDEDSS